MKSDCTHIFNIQVKIHIKLQETDIQPIKPYYVFTCLSDFMIYVFLESTITDVYLVTFIHNL